MKIHKDARPPATVFLVGVGFIIISVFTWSVFSLFAHIIVVVGILMALLGFLGLLFMVEGK